MNLFVLNRDFEIQATLDDYESLIWNDRYCGYGDFEIYTPFSSELLAVFQHDYYLLNTQSEHVMIIEDVEITTDAEEGSYLIITGRSLESILARRIVWSMTTLKSSLEVAIQKLLNENVIQPTDTRRTIENFIYEPSGDLRIEQFRIEQQITGENLYDAIVEICEDFKIGFKITLNEDHQFVFKLYSGADRSSRQGNRSKVMFSPKFDNLINSDFKEVRSEYKSTALVAGEGEGSARKTQETGDLSVTDLDRREIYVDARDISTKKEDGSTIGAAAYNNLLIQRGKEKLSENSISESFEGKVEDTTYTYQQDYFIGDIVELENEFGITGTARITEYVYSHTQNAIEFYPTFQALTEDEYYDATTFKLTPAMTGNGSVTGIGLCSGSDWYRSGNPENYSYTFYKAFDEVNTSYWLTRNTNLAVGKRDYIQFTWPNGEKVVPLRVVAKGGYTSPNNRVAKMDFQIQDEDGEFITVAEQENTKKANSFEFNLIADREQATNAVRIGVYSLLANYVGVSEINIYGRK